MEPAVPTGYTICISYRASTILVCLLVCGSDHITINDRMRCPTLRGFLQLALAKPSRYGCAVVRRWRAPQFFVILLKDRYVRDRV